MRRFNLKRTVRGLGRGERGSQVLEAAVMLPVLLMLFGATAEFGRFFYTYSTLTNAVSCSCNASSCSASHPRSS